MKKSLVFLFIAGFTFGNVIAEVPTKPSYANSSLKAKETKDELKAEINEEKGTKEGSRGMLNNPSLEEKKSNKNNVLKKTKSGRLAESNKHLDK